MNQGTHPEELPAEVLDDVASVVGAEVTLLSRLPGGVNGGAMRVQLAGRANAVLKAVPRAHPNEEPGVFRTVILWVSMLRLAVAAIVLRLRLVCDSRVRNGAGSGCIVARCTG